MINFLLVAGCSRDESDTGLRDQRQWSIAKCGLVFAESIKSLSTAFTACREKSATDHLLWDKDDQAAMDFVAACANVRAHIFGIPQKTRFDIKCNKKIIKTNISFYELQLNLNIFLFQQWQATSFQQSLQRMR